MLVLLGAWVSGQGQRGAPPPATGTAFVAGQVIDSPSGRPLPDAIVSLTVARLSMTGTIMLGGTSNQPVVTDSQGRFVFANLPAGSYAPRASKTGYAPASMLARVTDLADGERVVDMRIRLVKLGAISGALRDDGGDPIVGTDVMAFRRTLVNGHASLRPAGQSRTNDLGAYHISGLTPGQYFVCACGHDAIPFDGVLLSTLAADPLQLMGIATRALKLGADAVTLDNTLRTVPPTFYPASTAVARATAVTVAAGDEKASVDITAAPVHAVRVSGTIPGAVSPLLASDVSLVPAGEDDDVLSLVQIPPVLVQPDGRFDFANVPPGQYVLRVNHTVTTARGGGPSGEALQFLGARGSAMGNRGVNQTPNDYPLWSATTISVGDEDVRDLNISLRPGVRVGGRVQFIGSGPPPTAQAIGGMAVLLTPLVPSTLLPAQGAIGRVTPDGSFQMLPVVPGRYFFNTTLVQRWTTLKSLVIGGTDVVDMPIEIGASDLDDFTLTFTDAPLATLTAALSGGPAAPGDDVCVLVFPTDRKYWADPAAARRRFVTAPIGPKGTSSAAPLPAGEYFVIAVPDEDAAEWQEPSKLDTLAKTAQRVQVADGDKMTVEVKR